MIKKIEKYKEVVEEIAKIEKDIIILSEKIVELDDIDELKKQNKLLAKMKADRDIYREVQLNLINLFKKETDHYIQEFKSKLSVIASEHQKEHESLHNEIAMAINNFLKREKEINFSYSKAESELEEKRIVEFLTRISGKDYWNNSGITGMSNRISTMKNKLSNPFSALGI